MGTSQEEVCLLALLFGWLCFVARRKENRKTYERGTVPEYQTNGKKLGLGFSLCSLGFLPGLLTRQIGINQWCLEFYLFYFIFWGGMEPPIRSSDEFFGFLKPLLSIIFTKKEFRAN